MEPAIISEDYESKYVPLLLKHLDPEKHDLSFICTRVGHNLFGKYSTKVYYTNLGPARPRGIHLLIGYFMYMIASFFRAISVGKTLRPHLIVSLSGHTYSGLIVSTVSGIVGAKSVVRIAGPTRDTLRTRYSIGSLFSALAYVIERLVFRQCNALISNSDISYYLPKGDRNKLQVVSQGVDTELYRPIESVRRNNDLTIITVARLSPEKRIGNLIEAIGLLTERYPNTRLAIVGDGPDRQVLSQLAVKENVDARVDFTGFLSQEQVRNELVESSVFVLPSLRESLPSAMLEAMACKIPTIVAKEWISRLEFEHNTHTVVCDASPKGIAEAVKRIFSDDTLKNRIIENAHRVICESYSLASSRTRFSRIITTVLKR